ncbi:hypothetical protein GCK32_001072, partial [Trichostrongylus colubriformis]
MLLIVTVLVVFLVNTKALVFECGSRRGILSDDAIISTGYAKEYIKGYFDYGHAPLNGNITWSDDLAEVALREVEKILREPERRGSSEYIVIDNEWKNGLRALEYIPEFIGNYSML